MAEGRIINNPNKHTLEMLYRKMSPQSRKDVEEMEFNAVGLFQTSVPGILYYSDRVIKTSKVYPVEIFGTCPQHFTTLAFFGDTSAVKTAMNMIVEEEKSHKNRII